LLLWWDKLSVPIINHLAVEKGLAVEARDTLLELLVYDEDEPPTQLEESKVTSAAVAETLLATWLSKTKLASEEFDDHARFVESQIQIMLISFGKRRPKVRQVSWSDLWG
jgi:solute carrier family 25 protein 16